ncbi:hypothetical protein LguiB_032684 [Lonicera macranthoides]
MAVNSSEEGQDAYGVAVLTDQGITSYPQSDESQLAFLSLTEVPEKLKTQLCLDTQLNTQNHIKLEMENADAYFPCIVDIDMEKGKLETEKTDDETFENLKNEDPLTRTLQRQISVKISGKFTQLLMNYSLILPKFISRDKSAADRIHDLPSNRLRKYKRSASFNSRKVVLLFSVLSSMGTMILIYLTLRVRQLADASLNA